MGKKIYAHVVPGHSVICYDSIIMCITITTALILLRTVMDKAL